MMDGLGTPNVPRDPEDPREKLKKYLEERMAGEKLMGDRGYREMSQSPQRELMNSNRDIGLAQALSRSAAQVGTIGGRSADTRPVTDYGDQLKDQNSLAMKGIQAGRSEFQDADDRQLKIKQYLADKMQAREDKMLDRQIQADKLKSDKIAFDTKQANWKADYDQRERSMNARSENQKASQAAKDPKAQGEATFLKEIHRKNAVQTTVGNQLKSFLKQFREAKTEDEKIRIGRLALKPLNSLQGPDAVGVEEAKRTGEALDFKLGNITGPGQFVGREVDDFARTLEQAISVVDGSVAENLKSLDTYNKPVSEAPKPGPYGDAVIQDGVEYVWDGSDYVEKGAE